MNFIRKSLSVILVLQLSCGHAFAEAARSPLVSQDSLTGISRAMTNRAQGFALYYSKLRSRMSSREIREKAKGAIGKARLAPVALARSSAHTGQTLLVIWIASLIIAAEQEYKMARLSGLSPDSAELKEKFRQLTNMSLNNFEVFSGIVGGGVFGAVFGTPLQYLSLLVNNKISRPLLGKLISAGAASLVTFLGWELCRHLWKEAVMNLDTAAEITQAEQLKVNGVLSGTASASDKEIFTKVVDRMLAILTFADPELTQAWVYNTWRLTLMTGEFVTLVLAMTSASLTASSAASLALGAIAPGAGHVTGFSVTFVATLFGGLAGAMIAHHLPNSVKEPVTKSLRATRRGFSNAQAHTNYQELRRILSYFTPSRQPVSAAYQLEELKRYLAERSLIRNRIMTAHFENIFLHHMRTLTFRQELDQVEIGRGKTSAAYKEHAAKLDPEIKREQQQLASVADAIIELYGRETLELQRLLGDRQYELPKEIADALGNHLKDVLFQLTFMTALLAPYAPEALRNGNLIAVGLAPAQMESYFNAFYFFGYKENSVQESLTLAGMDNGQTN
jgi:hypothetical protein